MFVRPYRDHKSQQVMYTVGFDTFRNACTEPVEVNMQDYSTNKAIRRNHMDRYLIESPHEAQECDAIIREIHTAGYLHYFEWGCHDGDHTGWAIIETESREHAKQIVPWQIRDQARVVKL